MVSSGFLTQRLMKGSKLNMRSKCSSDLRFYTSVCKEDSSLKSFDSSLYQRTNGVIKSLASRADPETKRLDSLRDVYGFIAEVNQDTAMFIIENREDVRKNKELKSLVLLYFDSTADTLDLCNTVEKCVRKTENGQLIIRYAVNLFEKESEVEEDSKKKKYTKTLEELNKFAAIGDPFDGEFVTQYEAVYEQQVLLLEKLHKQKEKLGKKKRNAKIWRVLSNVVFATAVASVIVLSVVLAAISAPQVAGAVASGLSYPIDKAGIWCGKMLKEFEKAVKRQHDLAEMMEGYAEGNNEATRTIKSLVDSLRITISSIMKTVGFATEREEEEMATRIAMKELKKRVEEFTDKFEEVGHKVTMARTIVARGRLEVLDHIFRLPTNSV